jgi:hypothetical protein
MSSWTIPLPWEVGGFSWSLEFFMDAFKANCIAIFYVTKFFPNLNIFKFLGHQKPGSGS